MTSYFDLKILQMFTAGMDEEDAVRPSLEDLTSQHSHLKIRLHDITLATNNFSHATRILRDDFYDVYRAEIEHLDNENFVLGEENTKSERPKKRSAVIIKRLLPVKKKIGEEVFCIDIDMFATCKHHNIVTLLGFCIEDREKIIVVEDASNGYLVKYLRNYKNRSLLTWEKRLKICLDIAYGLKYLHHEMEDQMTVIHRTLDTYSIALDENFGAKIVYFGLSAFLHPNQDSLYNDYIVGSQFHIDPEYEESGMLKRESDVYSFGVVLFEILCGRLASNRMYKKESKDGVAYVARQCFRKGTIMEIVDPIIKNVNDDNNFLTTKVPNKDSIETFVQIAYWCLSETQHQRPTMKDVVKELEKSLSFQQVQGQDSDQVVDGSDDLLEMKSTHENPRPSLEDLTSQISHLRIRLHDIHLATEYFSEEYMLKRSNTCEVYSADQLEVWDKEENFLSVGEMNKSEHPKKCTGVFIKRFLQRKGKLGKGVFRTDLEMLATCKHRNIVPLLGFCIEGPEKILIIEDASNGYLVEYLNNNKNRYILTWEKRLKICLAVAYGLKYLHHEMEDQKTVILCDLSTFSIALGQNFVAKIVDFKNAVFLPPNQEDFFPAYVRGNPFYVDPEYEDSGRLKRKSDVYSFGLILFELFGGRLADDVMYTKENKDGLASMARQCFSNGTLMEMIDPMFKEEKTDDKNSKTSKGVNKDSVNTFVEIAYKCLAETQDQRPTMKDVIMELEKALSFQENILKHLKIPLSDIMLATDSFSERYMILNEDNYRIYKAELEQHSDHLNFASFLEENNRSKPPKIPKRCTTVLIERRFIREEHKGEELFFKEVEMLGACKHPNVVTLLGFCDEDDEMILVFENTSKIKLKSYLKDIHKPILRWSHRLRICIDVANGLRYLHYEMDGQKVIIHCDIRSGTIVLDENLGARIANFDTSIFLPPYLDDDTLCPDDIIGRVGFMDPEYEKTGKLKRESDVYSFGVLMCEILCGKTELSYFKESDERLADAVRRCFHERTLNDMVDPKVKEESGDVFTLNRGPNTNSLDTFLEITIACLAETQDKRPTIKVVIEELEKALLFQENNKDTLRISLEDIQLATENFHGKNYIGRGGFGKVYKGKLPQSDSIIVAKQLDTEGGQGDKQFRNELQILFECKHNNIISLVGYCDKEDEKIIVYEYASRGSLDRYLSDAHLNWITRLNICIGVATALNFLHRGVGTLEMVIHRDIKPENILLTGDWSAKLGDFGLSLISAINNETDFIIDRACGTEGYVDPLYLKLGFLTKESDIYSFGVVLFEILCGRLTFETREGMHLPNFIKQRFQKGKGKHDAVVFEKIKEQIMPEALSVFQMIAYRCLNEKREERPTAKEILEQLEKALELQYLSYMQMSGGDGASTGTSY
ncbi:uncharacterized protein [Rutidosis leptorrhynchoides]|uniref:uncharacterized protein n=1 Tax=Rutidosis leptorrhynchoides TaxID=125765 RepID=UPI003A990D76